MTTREIARAFLHSGNLPPPDAKCCFDHVCFVVFCCEISGSDNFGCDAIFSIDKKRWIDNEEEDTFIGRSKIVALMVIRHLIIFRYIATLSQFSNFYFRGEAERETSRGICYS